MDVLLIAVLAGVGFLIAYHTYGKWLGRHIFQLSAKAVCPAHRLQDGSDYVPTKTSIVFGHHFTSIAGTGPIVGPAIAVMWGWLPALLWVVFGSILIGAVHDFGALVVSLRNNGQTVGEIAGRLINRRVRLLFLLVLFMALTIVLAIFGLVIAAVFKMFPAAIFPCIVQIPIAVAIGLWLHKKGVHLLVPSLLALGVMYGTVIFGNEGVLGDINAWFAGWPTIVWVAVLLGYSYVASVLPVWTLLQPRDYINSLQLISALGLIVIGLVVAALIGGAPPVEGAERQPLEVVAPMVDLQPADAPPLWPFLFITIACGAISGFHCLVSSGTSSKQLEHEPAARCVGYGAMLTEGFLATLVILACVAGLGLGLNAADGAGFATVIDGERLPTRHKIQTRPSAFRMGAEPIRTTVHQVDTTVLDSGTILTEQNAATYGLLVGSQGDTFAVAGASAYATRYWSWTAAQGLGAKVGAFVDGAANFLKAMGIPAGIAIALMGVLVASFAGTTLDTACRLQRYVVQELAACFLPAPLRAKLKGDTSVCWNCGYDLTGNTSEHCPECGAAVPNRAAAVGGASGSATTGRGFVPVFNPFVWLTNKHGATIFAVVIAAAMAAMPASTPNVSLWQAFKYGPMELHFTADSPEQWAVANEQYTLEGIWWWLETYSGTGGLILWPMFGATNQLLGGLAFLVIAFMLVMPAWAMLHQLPSWIQSGDPNWPLIFIAIATLALEAWMIVEAALLWPRIKGVLEEQLPGNPPDAIVSPPEAAQAEPVPVEG